MVQTISAAGEHFKPRSAIGQMIDKGREEQQKIYMDMFLARLKYQSYDDPMSPNDMTQDINSFFQLAEQTRTNELLQQSNDLKMNDLLVAAKGYLNKNVEYEGDVLGFEGDSQKIRFHMPTNVKSATLAIFNEDRQLVRNFPLSTTPGEAVIQWDGDTNMSSDKVPQGQYIVAVIAQDESGQTIEVPTILKGKVRQIIHDPEHNEFFPLVNNTPVSMTDILAFSKTESKDLGQINENIQNLLEKHDEIQQILRAYVPNDNVVNS